MRVAHALTIHWEHFPPEHCRFILRQYALFTILAYITQQRPAIEVEAIEYVAMNR